MKKSLRKVFSIILSMVMLGAIVTAFAACDPKLVEYKVTYNLDGGTNHEDNPEVYTTDDFPLKFAEPTKDGFLFAGWTSELNDEPEYDLTLLLGDERDLTLTANWELPLAPGNIRYKLGSGGTNHPSNPTTFTEAEAQIGVVISGEPTREGYIFDGWMIGSAKSTKSKTLTLKDYKAYVITAAWIKPMSADYGNNKVLAPDFTVTDIDGKTTVTLSQFRGDKPVFISFWAYSCDPCLKEMKNVFPNVYATMEDDFVLLAVHASTRPELDALLAKNGKYPFPVYDDAKKEALGKGYNYGFTPANYMVDKWGYLYNGDITGTNITSYVYGEMKSISQMKTIINGAIARASK